MNNLETLLIDPKLKNEFKGLIKQTLGMIDVAENFRLTRGIEKEMNNLSPETKKIFDEEIKPLLIKLKWRAFPRLKQGQVLDLLENHLLVTKEFKEIDDRILDIKQAVNNHLLQIIDHDERDRFKILVRQTLLVNKEVVDESLAVKTVGEWFKNIISQVGPQLTDRLKESEYYLRDSNFTKLSKIDQQFLKGVFSLYKYCLYSSITPEGLDETITVIEDGKMKVIRQGMIEEIPSLDKEDLEFITGLGGTAVGAKEETKYQSLTQHYHSLLDKLVKKEQLKAVKLKSSVAEILAERINKALEQKEQTVVLAGLERLIQIKQLAKILENKNFNQIFKKYLISKFGQFNEEMIKKFTVEVFALLLQFIFIDQLRNTEEEGAVLVLYIANLLAKQGNDQYLVAVYGDSKSNSFKWREIKIGQGQLKFG
ncbi:hypothetical protein KKF32_02005 [Patescibacteria group bacterium]|nr:hypothetical protein [Patescibacteria group bacterium]